MLIQNHSQANKMPANLWKNILALDMLCLFVAPIAGGAGNYMTLFFSAHWHWQANKIGILMAVMSTFLGVAQIPAGVLVDKVFKFKEIVITALSILVWAWLSMLLFPDFYTTLAAQAVIGITCAVFMPAMASITMGLVGLKNFDVRLGRNGVFSHAGNVLMAVLLAVFIALMGSKSVILLLICFSLLAIVAITQIDGKSIDYIHISKKTDDKQLVHPIFSGFASLLGARTAVLFTVAALLYTFADASMLTIMVQHIASKGSRISNVHVPVALFLTELVMIPVCYWAGKKARFGRKPLLIISYILLAVRGVCFSLTNDPNTLVVIQVLDGISAGIFGLMLTLVISDLSAGTGRFNATLTTMGMLFTLTNGVSNLVFGFMTSKFGYAIAFNLMAFSAALGGILIWALVPETLKESLLVNTDD